MKPTGTKVINDFELSINRKGTHWADTLSRMVVIVS